MKHIRALLLRALLVADLLLPAGVAISQSDRAATTPQAANQPPQILAPIGNSVHIHSPRIAIPSGVVPVSVTHSRSTIRAAIDRPAGVAPPVRQTRIAATSRNTRELASLSGGAEGIGCASAGSQPVPIVALASALKCDYWLIQEYVQNNIEFEPLYGSNKGALGTLLDRRGNDADQAMLMYALLDAAGYSQLGYLLFGFQMDGAQASSTFAVKNDYQAILDLLNAGGIPYYGAVQNPDGTLNSIVVHHFVVTMPWFAGGWIYFNPSFKPHSMTQGIASLADALSYSRTQFLDDVGGTFAPYSFDAPNRDNLRADLTAYAANLLNHINAHDRTWAVKDVIGGKAIQPSSPVGYLTSGTPYSTFPDNCPYQTPIVECRTFVTIRMPGAAANQAIKLYTDEVYGHRITVFSVASGANFIPTLLIDGAAPACVSAGTCTNVGPATASGQTWSVDMRLVQPNQANSSNCPTGVTATECKTLTIAAGGSYLVSLSVGQVGRGMAEYHRQLLATARATGNADGTEPVLGESLAVMSYNWIAQNSAIQQSIDPLVGTTTLYKFAFGITGQRQIQQSAYVGPYVDLPVNFSNPVPQDSSGPSMTIGGYSYRIAVVTPFMAANVVASSLESAVLIQTQAPVSGMTAASTIKILDANVAGAMPMTYFADGTTSAGQAYYISTISPAISAYYGSADLSAISAAVSAGRQVLIPANGTIGVGVWTGAGYTSVFPQSSILTIAQLITGGMAGGMSGTNIPDPEPNSQFTLYPAANSDTLGYIVNTAYSPVNPQAYCPVDAVTGAYIYEHDDLNTGSGDFPYSLVFSRTYLSSLGSPRTTTTANAGMGNGWKHSFGATVQIASNPYTGIGLAGTPAANAVAGMAALFVLQDLLSVTPTAQTMTVASLVAQWLTDRITSNVAMVTFPNTTEEFVALPHADGATAINFGSPPGSSARLSQLTAGEYAYRAKDGVTLNFGGTVPAGLLQSWIFPKGMAVNLTYSGSRLSQVSNTLGRTLTLSYSGNDVTSVTDDVGRSVSYGYDQQHNLTTFTDPLGTATEFRYDSSGVHDSAGHLTQVIYPFRPANAFITNWYDGMGRVVQQANGNGALSYLFLAGSRTELIDAMGNRHVTYQTDRGRVLKDLWILNWSVGDVFNDTPQSNGYVNVQTYQYDGLDRLSSTTLPEGNGVAYAYDATVNPWANNVASITRNAKPGSTLSATVTSFTYDPLWNKPVSVTDPLGRVSTARYDPAKGNLLSTVADAGTGSHFNAKSSFTYNGVGQVLTATDPLGTVTVLAYDSIGNLTSRTADSGTGRLNRVTGFAYDTVGNVTTLTDPRGNMTAMTYDANRRLITSTAPAPFNAGPLLVRTTNAYDADGHLTTVTRANGGSDVVTTSAYTATGKVASVTDPNGNKTTYAYDLNDRLSTVTQPASGAPRVTSFSYDALGRTTAVTNTAIQSGPLEQTAYTANGQQATFTDANGNVTGYVYDGFDRLAKTTYAQGTSLASSESFTYDGNDNTLTRTTRRNDVIAFSYDTLNRRTAMTPPAPTPTISYSYDLAGRLTGTSSNGPAIVKPVPPSGGTVQYATTLAYDQLNRPVSVSWDPTATQTAPTAGSITFTHGYNAANQRVTQGVTDNTWIGYPSGASSTAYTANALNQYTAVGTITPTYDQSGNLAVADTFDAVPTAIVGTTNYVTDPEQRMVLEYNGATGAIRNWYAYGLGSNEVLNRMDVTGSTRQTLIPDIQGSTVATLDSTGTLAKRGYLPFGEGTASTGAFGYTGQYLDSSGLYNYRARVYSSALGRFLQSDPIGYAGGRNLLAYVGNDPLNAMDPSGKGPFTDTLADQFSSGAIFQNIYKGFDAGLQLAAGAGQLVLGRTLAVGGAVTGNPYAAVGGGYLLAAGAANVQGAGAKYFNIAVGENFLPTSNFLQNAYESGVKAVGLNPRIGTAAYNVMELATGLYGEFKPVKIANDYPYGLTITGPKYALPIVLETQESAMVGANAILGLGKGVYDAGESIHGAMGSSSTASPTSTNPK